MHRNGARRGSRCNCAPHARPKNAETLLITDHTCLARAHGTHDTATSRPRFSTLLCRPFPHISAAGGAPALKRCSVAALHLRDNAYPPTRGCPALSTRVQPLSTVCSEQAAYTVAPVRLFSEHAPACLSANGTRQGRHSSGALETAPFVASNVPGLRPGKAPQEHAAAAACPVCEQTAMHAHGAPCARARAAGGTAGAA